MNDKSTGNKNLTLEEDGLINLLGSFQPIPSDSFHKKMEKTPWKIQPRLYKYAFQICITAGILLVFILINPTTSPIYPSTNTPTQTHTSNPANFSTPELNATPAPSNSSPSTTPLG